MEYSPAHNPFAFAFVPVFDWNGMPVGSFSNQSIV